MGKEVATLVNGQKTSGRYNVQFDGSILTSGIYFYKISAGDASASRQARYNAGSAHGYTDTKKLMLMK